MEHILYIYTLKQNYLNTSGKTENNTSFKQNKELKNTPTGNEREHNTVIWYALNTIATLALGLLPEPVGRFCY